METCNWTDLVSINQGILCAPQQYFGTTGCSPPTIPRDPKWRRNILEQEFPRCHSWGAQSDSESFALATTSSRIGWFSGLKQNFHNSWVVLQLEPPSEVCLFPALRNFWSLGLQRLPCFQPWQLPQSSLLHSGTLNWYPGDYHLLRMERGMGIRYCWGAWLWCDPPQQVLARFPLENKSTWHNVSLLNYWRGAHELWKNDAVGERQSCKLWVLSRASEPGTSPAT